MAKFEFRLADVGEGIHDVVILEWKVKPGDRVQAFDPLCEVESAKAAVELTAPVAGLISEIQVPLGATARVGDVLVSIETANPADLGPAEAQSPPEPPGEEWLGIVGTAPRPAVVSATPAPARAENAVRAAPLVRKLARERGIRLTDVIGTGPEGRIRLADLEAHRTSPVEPGPESTARPVTSAAPANGEERIPLQGLRKRIADHMVESVRRAPQVTAIDLFDVTDLVRAREILRPAAEREGVKLTYLPFVAKAAVEALRAVPHANAVFDDASNTLVVKHAYNLGIATAVPGGLVVPVLKNAETRSILEIAAESARLIEAARALRSRPDDLQDGSFTITSFGGMPGSPLFATPILNYPEVAILGVGRIEEQPRVVGGQIVPRHCLGVSFTFDHRVLDGEGAGQFLAALRRYLEQPLELLLRLR